MIGNILKVIAALIVGYLVGILCGGVVGLLLGLAPSLFFREIVASNQTALMSVLLALISGGLLGLLEVQIFNRLFTTSDNPLIGMAIGIIFGLIFGVFGYGVLDMSSSDTFLPVFYPGAMIYGGALGSRIGEMIFSLFAAAQTIREIVQSYKVESLTGKSGG
jgi:hypothetical protein